MKVLKCLIPALLGILLLTGCSSLLESRYISVKPHTELGTAEEDKNVLTAENYLSLKNAILSLVEDSVEEGVIRVSDYSGDLEEELQEAIEEVSTQDPLGSYAVEEMHGECSLIVSYYEIRIETEFRRTAEQIQSVQRVASIGILEEQLQKAMQNGDPSLTVRLSYYNGEDIAEMARSYYRENPSVVMEMPQMTVNVYPRDGGYVRILEMLFTYEHTAEELKMFRDSVETSARAAGEYVRYRDTETDKLQLLYTYLQERFAYAEGTSSTPVYSFLCEGVASSEGAARSLQIICDEMDLECYTVEGTLNGEPWVWNIVCVDGVYCHADLQHALMNGSDSLTLYTDDAMTAYEWDRESFPACP